MATPAHQQPFPAPKQSFLTGCYGWPACQTPCVIGPHEENCVAGAKPGHARAGKAGPTNTAEPPYTLMLQPLPPEEIAWVGTQPVTGTPGFARLKHALTLSGFSEVELKPAADRETVDFTLRPRSCDEHGDADGLLRLLITTFRFAGFAIGFEDLCVTAADGKRITGTASTTSVNDGPPEAWQLPAADDES